MPSWTWEWGWGWGWAATVGTVLGLAIFVLPWFFFLLNLNTLLDRVKEENRSMPPSHVWLNFIPIFNLGWFLYTVVKVRDSVKAEYASRGWPTEEDFAYNVGLVAGILWIASFFLWWVPLIGWAAGIGWLVCWIIYWLKTSDLKSRLGESGAWQGGPGSQPYSGPGGPSSGPYDRPGAYPPGGGYAPPGPYAQPGPSGQRGPYGPPAGQAGPQPYNPPPGAYNQPSGAYNQPSGAYNQPSGAYGPPPGQSPSQAPAPEGDRSRRCAACGAAYDPEDKFCRSCGLPLP